MSEQDQQDRNLPASERKLKKAREDGNVPRSRDFGHFAAVAGGGAALVVMAPTITRWMQELLANGLRFDARAVANPGFMAERLEALTLDWLWVVMPMGLLMMALAVGASVAIGGWNFTMKAVRPQFSKLNPLTGIPNLFSKQQFVTALKASLLALLLGLIGAFYLRNHIEEFVGVLGMPLPAGMVEVGSIVLGGLMLVVLLLAAFALVDAPLQRFLHASRLKMSQQEVKKEFKEQEGNQEIKAHVRKLMREASRRRMMAAVPTADLVVMNPTHYAVALKYDDTKMGAPRVVAKGADLIALAIRDLAKSSKVPVLQAPPLARALYAHAELDREIPAALFAAVAQVLAYVYQLRAALAGDAAMPDDLPDLPVPEELDPHHGKE